MDPDNRTFAPQGSRSGQAAVWDDPNGTVGRFFGVTTRRSRETIAHSAILAKTDQQQQVLCDRLEASLTGAQDHSRRLLDTLLAEALTPTEAAMPAETPRVATHG